MPFDIECPFWFDTDKCASMWNVFYLIFNTKCLFLHTYLFSIHQSHKTRNKCTRNWYKICNSKKIFIFPQKGEIWTINWLVGKMKGRNRAKLLNLSPFISYSESEDANWSTWLWFNLETLFLYFLFSMKSSPSN